MSSIFNEISRKLDTTDATLTVCNNDIKQIEKRPQIQSYLSLKKIAGDFQETRRVLTDKCQSNGHLLLVTRFMASGDTNYAGNKYYGKCLICGSSIEQCEMPKWRSVLMLSDNYYCLTPLQSETIYDYAYHFYKFMIEINPEVDFTDVFKTVFVNALDGNNQLDTYFLTLSEDELANRYVKQKRLL